MQNKKVPTMKDLAREAGVSLGTVSKVVNGLPVGKKYRDKVNQAILKLNYRVNTYARGLKSKNSMMVGVIVPNLFSPYFSKLVHEIGKNLVKHMRVMLVYCTSYDPVLEQQYVTFAEMRKVDGIICLSYNPDLQITESLPFVSIDRYFSDRITCVSSDNFAGGRIAAERLYKNGCRHLVALGSYSTLSHEPVKRLQGFNSMCSELQVDFANKTLADGEPYTYFEDFLKEHCHDGKLDFDGIFCATDYLAHQVKCTLRDMGIEVPEDVQIIGFDGIRVFADLELSCSTIVQPVEAIAAAAVEAVLSEKSNEKVPLLTFPVHYLYGGTTIDRD